jgi:hypothetical protein
MNLSGRRESWLRARHGIPSCVYAFSFRTNLDQSRVAVGRRTVVGEVGAAHGSHEPAEDVAGVAGDHHGLAVVGGIDPAGDHAGEVVARSGMRKLIGSARSPRFMR